MSERSCSISKKSALDSEVVAWSQWDGCSEKDRFAGDSDDPPYSTGLAALRNGWRLIQMSLLLPANSKSTIFKNLHFLR